MIKGYRNVVAGTKRGFNGKLLDYLLGAMDKNAVLRFGVQSMNRVFCGRWVSRHKMHRVAAIKLSSSTFFKRIGIQKNDEKTKIMTCLPGKIRVAQMEEEYASQQTGIQTSTTKCRPVDCKVCGPSLRL
jgi:hypothetical protein